MLHVLLWLALVPFALYGALLCLSGVLLVCGLIHGLWRSSRVFQLVVCCSALAGCLAMAK